MNDTNIYNPKISIIIKFSTNIDRTTRRRNPEIEQLRVFKLIIDLDMITVYAPRDGQDYSYNFGDYALDEMVQNRRSGGTVGENVNFDWRDSLIQSGDMDSNYRFTQNYLDKVITWNLDPSLISNIDSVNYYYGGWEGMYLVQHEYFMSFEPSNPDAIETKLAEVYSDAVIDYAHDQELIKLVAGVKGYETWTVMGFINEKNNAGIHREFPSQFYDYTIQDLVQVQKDGVPGAKKALKLLKESRFQKY